MDEVFDVVVLVVEVFLVVEAGLAAEAFFLVVADLEAEVFLVVEVVLVEEVFFALDDFVPRALSYSSLNSENMPLDRAICFPVA